MLPVFFSSSELRNKFNITFSYRFSERYTQGLNQRVKSDFPIIPISFPEIYHFQILPTYIPILVRRIYFFIIRFFCTIPLLIYEIITFYRLFKKIKPDIVHINNGGYPSALSARAAAIGAKIACVPAIVMVINNMAQGYNSLFRCLDYPIDKLVAYSVDKFVTGSVAASNEIRKVLRLPENKMLSIHNGISYRAATTTTEETRRQIGLENFQGVIFGVVGLLIPRKGHQILLESLVQLDTQKKINISSFKIVIIGDGPLRKKLEDFAKNNGISRYCIFLGERNDVMNYMALFDAIVLSSIENEDFPFVILEAMSHGKPVIASKVAGTVEQVVNHETGILIDPGDVSQLSSAISKIATSRSLRYQMGDAGFKYFQNNFTSEITLNKYINLYNSLVKFQSKQNTNS